MKFNLVKVLFNFRVTQQQQVWVLCWLMSLSIGIRVSISKYNAGSGLSALSEKVGSRSFLHRLGVNGLLSGTLHGCSMSLRDTTGHLFTLLPPLEECCVLLPHHHCGLHPASLPSSWWCVCASQNPAWSCWLCLLVRIVVLIFWERVLLCCSSWPRTCHCLPSAYLNTGNTDV